MTREPGRRPRRPLGAATTASLGGARRLARTPAVEPLEHRRLLAQFFSGPTPIRPVQAPGGMYLLTMNGPGLEKVQHLRGGAVALTLFGTTPASTLNVALTRPRPHATAAPLQIASIKVVSGQLGGITAGGALLTGPVTPLAGQVNTLQFAGLGPNAQIDVNGPLGSLTVGSVALGPGGHVRIAGDLGQTLSVGGPLSIDGGTFVVGHDLTGSLNVGSLTLTRGGSFLVGHDLNGGALVNGDLSISANGVFAIGHNLGGLTVGQSASLDSGSLLGVGNDLVGAIDVTGGLSLSNNAHLNVGRDVTSSIAVNGDLTLASGGALNVGRNLNALTVNGNLQLSNGGGPISVGGNLTNLTVNGTFTGNGSADLIDLSVGLDLGQLTVLGGGAGQGGLQGANIDVGKSILGLNIPHGVFNSWITAGVLIDGGTTSPAGSFGPDGADAVVNSRIFAGVEINHLTINGNVRSTFPGNPKSAGYPTRIVAGEDRAQTYTAGGQIDNFQITGSLIDSVVAASVAPYGGNGTLPKFTYGSPPPVVGPPPGDNGNNTYDAPAGVTVGGTVGAPVKYANFTELSYYNMTLTGVAYDTALDPTIDDAILPGAINASFASAPLPASAVSGPTANPDAKLPLPTKSTVLGGVISTKHGDEADFAGLFAADTRGVFIGNLPS